MDYLKILNNKPFELKSIKELKDSIKEYFDYCDYNKESLSVTGLALYLGTNRQTLVRYGDSNYKLKKLSDEENKELCDTIKQAKAIIEYTTEKELKQAKNATGYIFNLKNNFGWVDKQEIVASTNNTLDFSDMTEAEIKNLLAEPKNKLIE